MPVLLALTSALVYGMGDYCGGKASRVQPSAIVALIGQLFSIVMIVVAVLLIGTPQAGAATWWWGGLGGAAGAVGLAALYYGLANGAMSVVAPLTAVVGAVLPVVVGIASGERPEPIAYLGIALAIAAVALVSGATGHDAEGERRRTPRLVLVMAVVAGLGFGLLFVAFDRTADDAGLWPLVAARSVSIPMLVVLALATRSRPVGDRGSLGVAVLAGVFDMAANVTYLAAARGGLLSVVAVVSSLYPASTVGLAFVFDGERVTRSQTIGLGLAALALVFVTLGRG